MYREERQVSRRWLLETTGKLVAATTSQPVSQGVTFLTAAGVDTLYDHFFGPINRLKKLPRYDTDPSVTELAYYPPETVKDRCIAVVGDSLGAGHEEWNSTRFPSTQFVVNEVNSRLGYTWDFFTQAKDQSTTNAIPHQIDTLIPDLSGGKPIDLVISAGPNDIRKQIGESADRGEIQAILQDIHNPALIGFARGVLQAIDDYQIRFAQTLQMMSNLRSQELNVQTIFVIGVGDIGRAQAISFPTGNGELSLNLEENPVARLLATTLSLHLNAAMVRAINQVPDDPAVQILFLDNFPILMPGDFKGMHPKEPGYKKMADVHLGRYATRFDGTDMTLRDAIKKRGA